ncbi:MAG: flavodoxin family protein [Rikenellaceae bacterium]|jgi:multimeric flavodoxin WrbA|nr:flavodoxin family protein [Rikenellaceae bacterium]
MKVVAINGSPRKEGNTALALGAMGEVFKSEGIELEIIHIGAQAIHGCMGCGACGRNRNGKCIVAGDAVNEAVQKMSAADGIVLGSPVYYAGIAGTMKCFLDRAFYVAGANGGLFAGKVGTAVVSARRSGTTPTFAGLNYYLTIANMFVAGSGYWNNVHGAGEGEAAYDGEGVQTVRNAARNMAWFLKMREAGREVPTPEYDYGAHTNFIR